MEILDLGKDTRGMLSQNHKAVWWRILLNTNIVQLRYLLATPLPNTRLAGFFFSLQKCMTVNTYATLKIYKIPYLRSQTLMQTENNLNQE